MDQSIHSVLTSVVDTLVVVGSCPERQMADKQHAKTKNKLTDVRIADFLIYM